MNPAGLIPRPEDCAGGELRERLIRALVTDDLARQRREALSVTSSNDQRSAPLLFAARSLLERECGRDMTELWQALSFAGSLQIGLARHLQERSHERGAQRIRASLEDLWCGGMHEVWRLGTRLTEEDRQRGESVTARESRRAVDARRVGTLLGGLRLLEWMMWSLDHNQSHDQEHHDQERRAPLSAETCANARERLSFALGRAFAGAWTRAQLRQDLLELAGEGTPASSWAAASWASCAGQLLSTHLPRHTQVPEARGRGWTEQYQEEFTPQYSGPRPLLPALRRGAIRSLSAGVARELGPGERRWPWTEPLQSGAPGHDKTQQPEMGRLSASQRLTLNWALAPESEREQVLARSLQRHALLSLSAGALRPEDLWRSGRRVSIRPISSDTAQSDTAQSDTAQSDTAQSSPAQSSPAQSSPTWGSVSPADLSHWLSAPGAEQWALAPLPAPERAASSYGQKVGGSQRMNGSQRMGGRIDLSSSAPWREQIERLGQWPEQRAPLATADANRVALATGPEPDHLETAWLETAWDDASWSAQSPSINLRLLMARPARAHRAAGLSDGLIITLLGEGGQTQDCWLSLEQLSSGWGPERETSMVDSSDWSSDWNAEVEDSRPQSAQERALTQDLERARGTHLLEWLNDALDRQWESPPTPDALCAAWVTTALRPDLQVVFDTQDLSAFDPHDLDELDF